MLFLMPAAWGLPDEAAGRVVSVVSGDSLGIEMLISDPRTNEIDSIKLADIDAPSTVTAEGKAAKAYVATLLKNKTVFLDIEDNISRCRSQWGQLICLVYLRDESGQPLWPPVNRIMVDEGYALLDDDAGNEFNASAWWGQPSLPLSGEKSDQLNAMLEKSSSAKLPEESNEVSILKKSSTSGAYVIGYHNR
ncbi:MAG: thermonuclease family protein [Methanothrix sp.]|nr:thermonuclease family protein [Methanothrix sp.]